MSNMPTAGLGHGPHTGHLLALLGPLGEGGESVGALPDLAKRRGSLSMDQETMM